MSRKTTRLKNKLLVESALRRSQSALLKTLTAKKTLLEEIFRGTALTELKVISPRTPQSEVTFTCLGRLVKVDTENNQIIFEMIPQIGVPGHAGKTNSPELSKPHSKRNRV